MSNPFADTQDPAIPADTESQGIDVIGLIRRSLRGRWLIAGAAGAALAIPAALLGYNAAKIEYAASVGVEVLQAPNTLIYDQFRNDTERIREYIRRQEAQVRGQRVLELAVAHPDLRAIDWPSGTPGQQALRDSIRVEYRNLSTNFTVRTVHNDPTSANAAIKAVVETYNDIHRELNSPDRRARELQSRINQVESQITQLGNSIEAATAELGTTNLQPLIDAALEERRLYQTRIIKIQDEIALREQTGRGNEPLNPDELNVDELAQFDDELARLLAVRADRQAQIDTLLIDLLPRHPSVKSLNQEIASIDRLITDRVDTIREQGPIGGIDPIIIEGSTIEQLEFSLARARQKLETVAANLRRYNQTAKEIERDQDDLELARGIRADLADQLSKLDIERENLQRGRILIQPITPATIWDDKRKPFAAAGFIFGGAIGVGLVIAYGAWRRTFRYVDDIDNPASLPPLLGTLPELDRKDPDAERIAAVSVHNLRNTLHSISRYSDSECQVIVCTSAEPADGKTTLIQSLGASYALTGLRTIIVDLDLVGGGLSARLGMSGRRGVADLLGGLEPTKCIKRTATEKLYALPAGDGTACKPEQLAHRPVQQVIDWLRERFDVVLIDTGPVLGSLEAGLTVGLADQILLVIPRGQSERLSRAAVTRLRRLGASNIGLVFNRADTTDLKQSLSAASIGAPSLRQTQRRIHERRLDQDASIVGSIPPPPTEDIAERRAAEDGTGP